MTGFQQTTMMDPFLVAPMVVLMKIETCPFHQEHLHNLPGPDLPMQDVFQVAVMKKLMKVLALPVDVDLILFLKMTLSLDEWNSIV